MSKTLFHSEIAKAGGPVKVTVKSDVLKSKFKGKSDFVILQYNGEERNYNVENPECGAFFKGQNGRSFALIAEGRAEDATLEYVGESAAEPEEQEEERPRRRAPAKPPKEPVGRHRPPPRADARHEEPDPEDDGRDPEPVRQPARPPKPAAAPAETPEQKLLRVRVAAAKMANLELVSFASARYIREQVKAQFGEELTPEHFQGICTTIAIQLAKMDMMGVIPGGLIHVGPKPATTEAAK